MRRTILYMLLIFAFMTAFGFSLYFYQQSQIDDEKIMAAMTSEDDVPNYHFALIGEEMNHEYWRLVGQGAKTAEANHDVYVEYGGPERSNPDEQLKLLDMAIKSKVDGIIVQALNEQFTPLINQAVKKGIPVITIDTDASESMRDVYIGTDNYLAGQLAGKALAEDTKGEATVGIISGSFDNALHQLRVKGFTDIVEQFEGINIVAIEESDISRVDAEEKAYRMLNEHTNITAFYGTSSYNGVGIVAAAKSLKKENEMYVITFDAIDENILLLENGDINAIVEQQPFEMGYRGVEKMLTIIENKPFQDLYHTDLSIIRKSDLPNRNRQEGGAS
ncbi:sugar-binding protein [Halalkalibacter akibai]|uniref:Sugar ABC transporter n=1 Tax=Halalkalibacter akibai (strain ATCC 43226 / DSM 21942 / CIP 109018 / JCM 9157 / 1139) TaxID=1236973 RepID=W4QWX5_HALA3|nr:sugar-binding protein [Halalkalibacter akibai]GAE36596.1 sugar ABC transporter [Halalkalibacter akibai JCM 9157]